MFKIQLDHSPGKTFLCSRTEDLLTAACRQGIVIPVGCRGGGCGMCKIQVTDGMFERGMSSMSVLSEEERKENYSLACKTYPQGDIRINLTGEK